MNRQEWSSSTEHLNRQQSRYRHSLEMRSARGLIRPCRMTVLMADSLEEQWRACCMEWSVEKERDPTPVPSWNESRAYWKKRLENETWSDWIQQAHQKFYRRYW